MIHKGAANIYIYIYIYEYMMWPFVILQRLLWANFSGSRRLAIIGALLIPYLRNVASRLDIMGSDCVYHTSINLSI